MQRAVRGTAAETRHCLTRISAAADSWTCIGKEEKRGRTEVSAAGRESLKGVRTVGV